MIATLKASGVRRVYGLPGDSIKGFTDTLDRERSALAARCQCRGHVLLDSFGVR
jgi:thiamine pyrophosphate-dependent acetolactate synthase large subunit-like protein